MADLWLSVREVIVLDEMHLYLSWSKLLGFSKNGTKQRGRRQRLQHTLQLLHKITEEKKKSETEIYAAASLCLHSERVSWA